MSYRSALAVSCLVMGCAPPQGSGELPAWVSDTASYREGTPEQKPRLADRYREVASKIIGAARNDRAAYTKLAELTDRIGHRLSGSPALDRAIEWAASAMKQDGHEVRTEKVMVPNWQRGIEQAALVTPVARPLHIIGLGGTVATPKNGITAPVVVVRDFAALEANAAAVKGSIVLFDAAMPPWSDDTGAGYGETVQYRSRGPSRAAKLGALAVLVRSVTAHSLSTPHTGALSYDPAQPKIPAAAVTVEDSALIARLAAQGPVTVRLRLESQQLADAPSANVIGELKGRERPDEIVVIGAHIDSWDVGQGAHDDGAGCVIMMQAITVLKKLGLAPRRTIRVVLFTNEENGLRGGKQYAQDHAAELPKTVLALEADAGGFAPRGFNVEVKNPEVAKRVLARLEDLAVLLEPLRAAHVEPGYSGSDLLPMVGAGVVGLGLITDGRHYFDIHHTAADTLDKVDPRELADNVAAVAVMAYVIADLPERIDAP
ncbi:MAG: M20/M25/M40 family metallo-hydrolase [Kofleriaceae bacterium]